MKSSLKLNKMNSMAESTKSLDTTKPKDNNRLV